VSHQVTTERPKLKPHEYTRATLARDTDPRAEEVQLEILRRMPAERKFQLVEEAIKTSYELGLAGLRRRHPDASREELQRRLMGLLHGEELATRIWGPIPDESPAEKPS